MGRGLRLQMGSGKTVCALVRGRVSVLTLSITGGVLTQMRGLFSLCTESGKDIHQGGRPVKGERKNHLTTMAVGKGRSV